MSTDKKFKRLPTVTTPTGAFRYPKLTEIDYGTKEYPSKDGNYNVRLVLTAEEAAPLIAELTPLYEQAIVEGKEQFAALKIDTRKKLEKKNGKEGIDVNPLYTELFDEETEQPTGNLEFKFKMKAGGEKRKGGRWSRKPGIFDAKGAPFPRGVDIWGGSTGKVAFEPRPYFIPASGAVGLGLGLEAVQIISLVGPGMKSADSYGFAEEEGLDATTLEVPVAEAIEEAGVDAETADADGHDF